MFVANLIENRRSFMFRRKSANRKIVIERDIIRIISDSGVIEKEIKINSTDKITMQDRYDIPFGRLQDTFAEVKGVHTKNKLLLEQDGQTQEFEFVINSAHGIEQLKKEILYWKSLGYKVDEE